MALYDAGGQSDGLAVSAASATLRFAPGAAGVGVATTSTLVALLLFGLSEESVGLATDDVSAAIDAVLSGTSISSSSTFGAFEPLASGTSAGQATTSSVAAYIVHGATGTAAGQATTAGTVGLSVLVSGHSFGDGETEVDSIIDIAGTIVGTSYVLGSAQRLLLTSGHIYGTSALVSSEPMPIHGRATVVGEPVVVKVPLPVSAIVAPAKSFRYLQVLQRGDLPVYISNPAGPVSPVVVSFTLFQVRPDGSRLQVGPSRRVPAQGLVGEYYATGRAGEQGQPGDWVIRWEFQRTYQSAVQIKEMCFRVLDAVLANDPRDITPRVCKYGWN